MRREAYAQELYRQIGDETNRLYLHTTRQSPLEPFLEMVRKLSEQETYRGSHKLNPIKVYEILLDKLKVKNQTIDKIKESGHTPRVTMAELISLLAQSKYEAFKTSARFKRGF